jgi:hypothetical protein
MFLSRENENMKKPKKNGAEGINEHNQTTEPFDFGVSPYAPTVTGNRLPPDTPPIAMVRPGSQQQVPAQPPLIGAYPFLPPVPMRQNEKAASPVGSITPQNDRTSIAGGRKTQRLFPALVGLCFVILQVLLLANFALMMFGKWDNMFWVNVLYLVSDIFIWPVQALVHLLPAQISISTQIVTLLAILLYGMISRIVVRCLKLLLRTR